MTYQEALAKVNTVTSDLIKKIETEGAKVNWALYDEKRPNVIQGGTNEVVQQGVKNPWVQYAEKLSEITGTPFNMLWNLGSNNRLNELNWDGGAIGTLARDINKTISQVQEHGGSGSPLAAGYEKNLAGVVGNLQSVLNKAGIQDKVELPGGLQYAVDQYLPATNAGQNQARVQQNAKGTFDLLSPSGSIMGTFKAPQEAQTFGTSNYGYSFPATPVSTISPQNSPQSTTGGQRYQILDLNSMAQYTADQYERLPDGAVVLKAGVTPKPNTTKPYEQKAPTTPTTPSGGAMPESAVGTTDQAARDKAASDIIERSGLPDDVKMLFKTAIGNIKGTDQESILKAFDEIKKNTIDPRFKILADIAQKDFKDNFDVLARNRAIETEAEQTKATQNIEDTKKSLEASGLTFSGEGVKQLGAQSAYEGVNLEGLVPKSNRLVASSTSSRYQENLANLAKGAEAKLGTPTAQALTPGGFVSGSSTPYEGSLATDKTKALNQSLNDLISQYQTAQKLKASYAGQ